jgi:hypothetical protein
MGEKSTFALFRKNRIQLSMPKIDPRSVRQNQGPDPNHLIGV